jgi:hypothetical protein
MALFPRFGHPPQCSWLSVDLWAKQKPPGMGHRAASFVIQCHRTGFTPRSAEPANMANSAATAAATGPPTNRINRRPLMCRAKA